MSHCASSDVSQHVFEEHNQLLIVKLIGSEPVEELHVSLIYTATAPHQHPREAGGGGGGTGDG